MTRLESILVERDNMTLEDVRSLILDARDHVCEYDDPSEFMMDWFGLEADYLEDVL